MRGSKRRGSWVTNKVPQRLGHGGKSRVESQRRFFVIRSREKKGPRDGRRENREKLKTRRKKKKKKKKDVKTKQKEER